MFFNILLIFFITTVGIMEIVFKIDGQLVTCGCLQTLDYKLSSY